MCLIRVIRLEAGFVATTETDEVGSDHAMPGRRQGGDHVTVQKTPRWLTVHQQNWRRAGWSFVEIMHSKCAAVAAGNVGVVRLKWEVGQIDKTIIWRTKYLHGVHFRHAQSLDALAECDYYAAVAVGDAVAFDNSANHAQNLGDFGHESVLGVDLLCDLLELRTLDHYSGGVGHR